MNDKKRGRGTVESQPRPRYGQEARRVDYSAYTPYIVDFGKILAIAVGVYGLMLLPAVL